MADIYYGGEYSSTSGGNLNIPLGQTFSTSALLQINDFVVVTVCGSAPTTAAVGWTEINVGICGTTNSQYTQVFYKLITQADLGTTVVFPSGNFFFAQTLMVRGVNLTTQVFGSSYIAQVPDSNGLAANTIANAPANAFVLEIWTATTVNTNGYLNLPSGRAGLINNNFAPSGFNCLRIGACYSSNGPTIGNVGGDTVTTSDNYQAGFGSVTLALNVASAPNAPTLGPPANSSYEDTSGTPTFSYIYNATDGSPQNAYAFRRKVTGTSAYSYWNVASNSFQSTIVWNPISSNIFSITFPNGSWPLSTVYNWSIASQESLNNLQGQFASDFTITGQAGPGVAITSPANGSVNNTSPVITWTNSFPAGVSQTAYNVIIESGNYNIVPGQGVNVFSSGVVQSSITAIQCTSTLAGGGAFRVFLQITETGGETSNWVYTNFITQFSALPLPYIDPSIVPQTPGVYGFDGIAAEVTIINSQNILSAADASFETSLGGWNGVVNCSESLSTTNFLDGISSMKIQAGQAGLFISNGSQYTTVTPGKNYIAIMSSKANVSPTGFNINIVWIDSTGSEISQSNGVQTLNNTSGFVTSMVSGTAPIGTTNFFLQIEATASTSQLNSLTAPNLVLATTGGSIPSSTTLDYSITYTNQNGETTIGPDSSVTTAGSILPPQPTVTPTTEATLSPPATPAVTTATTGGNIPATTTRFYIVTALDDNGQTIGSAEVTVVTGASTATNANTFSWASVAGATSYDVYISTTTGTETLQASGITTTSYVDTAASIVASTTAVPTTNTTNPRTTWDYQLTSLDSNGNESYGGPAGSTTVGNKVLNATYFNTLNWPAEAGAASYNIYRYNGSTAYVYIGNSTTTTFKDTGQAATAQIPPTTNQTNSKNSVDITWQFPSANLVADSGFESGPASVASGWTAGPNWSIADSATNPHTGEYSLACTRLNTTVGNGFAQSPIFNAAPMIAGAPFVVSMYVYSSSQPTVSVNLILEDQNGVVITQSQFGIQPNWQRISIAGVTNKGLTGFRIILDDDPTNPEYSGNIIYIDDVQVETPINFQTQPSFEDGLLGGWGPYSNSDSVANSTAQAFDGTHSLAFTRSAAAITTPTAIVFGPTINKNPAFQSGIAYSASMWVFSPAACTLALQIQFYTANGGTSPYINVPANTWTMLTVDGIMPAGQTAIYAILLASSLALSQVVYIDSVLLYQGTTWTNTQAPSIYQSFKTKLYRTYGLTTGLLVDSFGNQFTDTGQAASGAPPTINTTGEIHFIDNVGVYPGDEAGLQIQVQSDAPVVYFPLTEGLGATSAINASGSGNGKINNTVTFGETGPIGSDTSQTCALFDSASGGNITAPVNFILPDFNTITAEGWFNVPNRPNGSAGTIFSIGGNSGGGSGGTGFAVTINYTSPTIFMEASAGVTAYLAGYNIRYTVQPNTWYHWVASYTAGVITLYVNGVLVTGGTGIGGKLDYLQTITLGGAGFGGLLAHTAVYPSVISGARAQAHYNAGTNLFGNTVQQWSRGGLTGFGINDIESTYDNGQTWNSIAPNLKGKGPGIYYDPIPPLGVPLYYRTSAFYNFGQTSQVQTPLVTSAPLTLALANNGYSLLSDPSQPNSAVPVLIERGDLTPSNLERHTTYKLLGNPSPLILADIIEHDTYSITFTFIEVLPFEAFLKLVALQRVLVLQTAGRVYYLRLGQTFSKPYLTPTARKAAGTAYGVKYP